jgi:hypothetical protein
MAKNIRQPNKRKVMKSAEPKNYLVGWFKAQGIDQAEAIELADRWITHTRGMDIT